MLTEIKVKEGNTYYKEIDGVLYTADEKTLVAYPAGKVLEGENGVFTVPASTEKLANYAFCGTQNVSTVVLPESLKVIGNCAFKGCSKLVSVDSSASKDEVTVGINAFDGCKSLKSYRVNDNSSPMILKGSILFSDDGKKLISYAAELESGTYTLPAGVNEIEAGAFSLNKFISTFAVAAENTLFKSEGGVLYNADMTTLIAYPVAKTGDAFVCPATVTAVSAYAFCGNASLKTVTLPASVEALAPHVLEDCASLEALTLLGNELDIHMNALKGCAKLKTINFAGNEAAWKNASDNASSGNDVILTATLNYNYKAN